MPKMKPDRDDSQGGLGVGGPQDGVIQDGSDERQQQQGEESQRQAGLGGGDQGEGAQRHPGGGSRDEEQQR